MCVVIKTMMKNKVELGELGILQEWGHHYIHQRAELSKNEAFDQRPEGCEHGINTTIFVGRAFLAKETC